MCRSPSATSASSRKPAVFSRAGSSGSSASASSTKRNRVDLAAHAARRAVRSSSAARPPSPAGSVSKSGSPPPAEREGILRFPARRATSVPAGAHPARPAASDDTSPTGLRGSENESATPNVGVVGNNVGVCAGRLAVGAVAFGMQVRQELAARLHVGESLALAEVGISSSGHAPKRYQNHRPDGSSRGRPPGLGKAA